MKAMDVSLGRRKTGEKKKAWNWRIDKGRWDGLLFWFYIGLLTFATVLFGAVHTYAYALVFAGVLLGSLVLLARSFHRDQRSGEWLLALPRNAALPLFFAMCLWMCIQMVPLPPWLVERLSPQAVVAGRMSLPAAEVVSSGVENAGWMTLAPYVHPVRMALIRWVVYGLFFLGLLNLLHSRKRLETCLLSLLVIGCIESVYGICEVFSGSPSILWYTHPSIKGAVKGTFINRNHFAAYAGSMLILAAAFVASVRTKKARIIRTGQLRLRSRLVRVLSGEQAISKRAFLLTAGGAIGLALILSASRGGILSAGLGLLALGIMLAKRVNYRRRGGMILLLWVVVAGYALQTGITLTEARFRKMDMGVEQRWRITRSVLMMFESYPLVGVGVGNFQYAYPKCQPAEFSGYYRYGHNDWAQFLAEAGIFGAVLLLAGCGLLLFRLLQRWRNRHHPYAVCLGAGGMAVLMAMGFHAVVEFHLRIPAVFLNLCAALAVAHEALYMKQGKEGARIGVAEIRLGRHLAGFAFAVGIVGLIVLNIVWLVNHAVAEAYCNTVPNSTLNRDPQPPVEQIRKAIAWDSGNAAYWFKLARSLEKVREEALQQGDKPHVSRLQEELIVALEGAVKRNPLRALYHIKLGWEYTRSWRQPDYHTLWLPAADLSMERAAFFVGDKHPRLHQEIGNYWIMRSKTIHPTDQAHHAAWARACWHYGKAQKQTQGKGLDRLRQEIRAFVWRFYPVDEYVAEALGG